MPTLVLQPDAAAGKDSMIYSSSPTTNQGTNVYMYCGTYAANGSRWRPIIAFDVSAIPAGSSIVAATLSLWERLVAREASGPSSWDVNVHRVLAAWVENEVTWNARVTGTNWTTAGCSSDGNDRVAVPSAALTLDATAAVNFVSWSGDGIVADVQAWVNGAANHGWLLTAPTIEALGAGAKVSEEFVSSDYATSAARPKLTVEYTEPSATCPVHLLRSHYLSQGVR